MKLRIAPLCLGVSGLLLALSCNIFSPTEANRHPERDRYRGYALVLEGKIKMRDGAYAAALELFDRALQANDSLSEAYFYRGKCILRLAEVDLQQVWDEINPKRVDTSAVPFLYHAPAGRRNDEPIEPFTLRQTPGDTALILIDSVFLQRKRIYDAVCQAIKGLDTIYYAAARLDGVITREIFESDYLVELSLKAMLGINDLNHNDSLDFHSEERKTYRIFCEDIPSLDSMDLDSLRTISDDPREINQRLDLIINTIGRADTSYNNFMDELRAGAQKSDKLDTNMAAGIGGMIVNFKDILPFFYYNDFLDNDGDWYNTDTAGEGRLSAADLGRYNVRRLVSGLDTHYVRLDRMIWIDWDYDERIDVLENGALHIGDPDHISQNPALYEPVDSAGAAYRRYRYTGGYTYEFIGGDWGVDEEIMDGVDNDGDGLTDEDTRISHDTLDDDGDYYDSDPRPLKDTTLNPMVWVSSDDALIDITGVSWDSVAIDPAFVAAHGLHQVLPASGKIRRYTGMFGAEFREGDYGLDEEWFDGLDNDGDGLVDEDIGERLPPATLRSLIISLLRSQGGRR